MIQSLYTAASGMTTQQKNIDNISNNISNINTVGYKNARLEFKDAVYETMLSPNEGSQVNNLQQGHGALLSSTNKDFTEGQSQQTDNVLDFSIIGNGFFALDVNGETQYTRNGNFKVSVEDDNNYLVNANGSYVLDNEFNRITLNGNLEDIKLDENLNLNTGDNIVRLGVFEFPNQAGLSSVGNSSYVVSESSGQATFKDDSYVKQYSLEMSNVDLADELAGMIRAQRAYQAAARAISTADEMEGVANNLRR